MFGYQPRRRFHEAHRFVLLLRLFQTFLEINGCFLIHFPCVSDQVSECKSLRVPKIHSISGVVGMLKLLAGSIYKQFFILDQ